jgi:hypothetical protein
MFLTRIMQQTREFSYFCGMKNKDNKATGKILDKISE